MSNIDYERDPDVLQEWRMNQGRLASGILTIGMDKEFAQRQFIEKAEDLGIPPVSWERKAPIYDPPKCLGWDPKSIDEDRVEPLTDGKSKSLCPVAKKLLTRGPETKSLGEEVETAALQGTSQPSNLWHGLSYVSGLVVALWATLGPFLRGASLNEEKRRLHARAWKEIEA